MNNRKIAVYLTSDDWKCVILTLRTVLNKGQLDSGILAACGRLRLEIIADEIESKLPAEVQQTPVDKP